MTLFKGDYLIQLANAIMEYIESNEKYALESDIGTFK
jgi:hypothetical protein